MNSRLSRFRLSLFLISLVASALFLQQAGAKPLVTISAEKMPIKTGGGLLWGGSGWNLWSNGYLAQNVYFPQTSRYTFDIIAKGDQSGAYPPKMYLQVDGRLVAQFPVSSTQWKTYSSKHSRYRKGIFNWKIPKGTRRVEIGFLNDYGNATSNRNLLIEEIKITKASGGRNYPTFYANSSNLAKVAKQKNMFVGAAVGSWRLKYHDNGRYASGFYNNFNSMVPEYQLKPNIFWKSENNFDFREVDYLVDEAKKRGMNVRGHTLVWHLGVPDWLKNQNPSRERAKALMKKLIQTTVKRYKGRIREWDVVNEAFHYDRGVLRDSFWRRTIGDDYIELAFRYAHQADPKAKLYYNDYNTTAQNYKSDGVYDLVKRLKQKNVPIHGVGFQTHLIDNKPLERDTVASNFKRFTNLGLEIHVTELDLPLILPATAWKLDTQAERFYFVTKTCAENSRCKGVTFWGFTDKHSYENKNGKGQPLILDTSYNKKDGYFAAIKGFRKR